MSVVDFAGLPIRRAVPIPVSFGRIQRPGTGAAAFRTDRLGNRWAFQFETPALRIEPQGARWQALFDDAERQGGLFAVDQPDFKVGSPGSPIIATDTAAGRILPLAGLTPHYAVRARQWLSIIVDGQRYLDRVMEQAIAEADGTAVVRIKNLIRVPLTAGDVVELGEPKIQGSIELEPPAWELERMTSFSFTVTEDA